MTQRNVREERRWAILLATSDDEFRVMPKGWTRDDCLRQYSGFERLVRVTILVPKGKK